MSGNFRVRCVAINGASCYTKDKIYKIVKGCLTGDNGRIIIYDLKSFENLQNRSFASRELVDEKEKEDNMNRNFKVKCVDTKGQRHYTTGKIYDITNGKFTNDDGVIERINSFKDLEEYSWAKWELVDEKEKDKENDMVSFKVKRVDTKGQFCYTKDKVYEIKDSTLTSDDGIHFFTGMINSINHLNRYSCADWESVEENTKNLSLTITSEKATISDGEDTLEINRDCYKNERDVISYLLDKYYDEKNKIKVGDSVTVVNNGYQYKIYSDFIFDNAEELQKQMSATEFARLILNFKIGESIPERESTYKVNLINSFFSMPNSDTKVAIISNDNDTFIIDIRGLEKVNN